jgi:hypothetical protein
MRLGGWTRIVIVLSGIWAIANLIEIADRASRRPPKADVDKVVSCSLKSTQRPGVLDELCLREHSRPYTISEKIEWVYPEIRDRVVTPIIFFAMGAMLILFIARWIAAGFRVR